MINIKLKGQQLILKTSNEVFSPSSIDKGAMAMLDIVEFKERDKVLDLGCGYGVVGILAAKFVRPGNVVMGDIDPMAIELSKWNIETNEVSGVQIYQSDGFKDFRETNFDLILSNPPYHVDFSVPKQFIEKGFNRLRIGGSMYLVTKRKNWYRNKMIAIFGGVRIWERDGYYIFMSNNKSPTYANKK